MDELVELATLVNIQNSILKTFNNWAQEFNTGGDNKKFYAYDTIKILLGIYYTWRHLYEVVATFHN